MKTLNCVQINFDILINYSAFLYSENLQQNFWIFNFLSTSSSSKSHYRSVYKLSRNQVEKSQKRLLAICLSARTGPDFISRLTSLVGGKRSVRCSSYTPRFYSPQTSEFQKRSFNRQAQATPVVNAVAEKIQKLSVSLAWNKSICLND
mgnify:CR=1 FL=1